MFGRTNCYGGYVYLNMFRSGTAATTENSDKTFFGKGFNVFSHSSRTFIVFTHSIRQTLRRQCLLIDGPSIKMVSLVERNVGTYSIGIADDMCVSKSADVLNERLHLIGTKSTVKTKSHWVCVLKGSDKGFTSLTGQGTTTLIDNGTRDEDGNLWASRKKQMF